MTTDTCLIEVRPSPFLAWGWDWRVTWKTAGFSYSRRECGTSPNRETAVKEAQRFANTLYLFDGWEIV